MVGRILAEFSLSRLVSVNPVSLSFDSFPSFLCLDSIIFPSATTFAIHAKWCKNLLLCRSRRDPASLLFLLLLPSHPSVHPILKDAS